MDTSITLIILLSFFTSVLSLSCYTCTDQEHNDECIEAREECLEFQDTCTSYISWRIAPHASLKGERTYSIYKGCDTRTGCSRRKDALGNHCGSRGYTFDWACIECCEGDLCNYEVERYRPWYWSSSSRPSVVTFLLCACVTLVHLFVN